MESFEPYSHRTKRRKIAAKVSNILTGIHGSIADNHVSDESDVLFVGSTSNLSCGRIGDVESDHHSDNSNDCWSVNKLLDNQVIGSAESNSLLDFSVGRVENQMLEHNSAAIATNNATDEYACYDDNIESKRRR